MKQQHQLKYSSEERNSDRIIQLAEINRLVVALNDADTLEEIYNIALEGTQQLLKVERGAILGLDSEGSLKFVATRGISEHYQQAIEEFVPLSWSNEYKEIILRPNLKAEQPLEPLQDVRKLEGIEAIASFPIIYKEQQLGRIVIYYDQPYQCSEEEIQIAETISTYTSVAVSRKQTEIALRQREELYRLTFEHAAVGFSHKDLSGRYLLVNQKLCEITGYTKDELLTKTYLEITYSDDIALNLQLNQQLQSGEISTFTSKKRYIRKDGKLIWVDLTVSMIYKHSGEPDYVIALVQDISDRVATEEALRESEYRYQALFNSDADSVFVHEVAPDGKLGTFQEVNNAACSSLGYTREELLQLCPDDIIEPSLRKRHKPPAIKGKPSYFLTLKTKHIRKDGSIFPVEVRVTLMERNGKMIALTFVRDITKQVAASEKLKQSQDRLELALEASRTNVWEVDLISKQVHLSGVLLVSAKLEARERSLSYTEMTQIIHPEDRRKAENRAKSCLLKNQEFQIEHRIVSTDGSSRWVLTRGRPIYDAHGNPLRLIGTSVDINDRKLIEQKLSKSEADLAEAQRVAHVGNWEFNLATQMRKWSAETFRIFGRNPDQGEPSFSQLLEQYVHPEDREIITKAISKAIDTNQHYESEYRVIRPNGEIIHVCSKADPQLDSSGKVTSFFGTIHDISDRKRGEQTRMKLEKELMESDLRTRLFSMTSHEFRTPLSTILMAAGILEYSNNDCLNEKSLRNLHRIQNAAKHLQDLLDQILTISRAETDKVSFNPQPLAIDHFCRQLVEEIHLAHGSHCQIRYASYVSDSDSENSQEESSKRLLSKDEDLEVPVDEKLLYSILTNLLLNAVKYSPNSKEVQFELEVKKEKPSSSKSSKMEEQAILNKTKGYNLDKIIFRIQDHGIGIPLEDQSRLFESFYRGKNVNKINGSGLGLTIVKKYVELHKGSIKFTSEEGVGTTFTVSIPLLSSVGDIPKLG